MACTSSIICAPALRCVLIVTRSGSTPEVGDTATGRCCLGRSGSLAVRMTVPKSHTPSSSSLTSAVNSTACVAPAATVNTAGLATMATSPVIDTVQVMASPVVFLKVRSQEHPCRQDAFARLARLSVVGSPAAPGSAASKLAVVSSSTRPASAVPVRSSRPAPTSKGSAGVVPSSLNRSCVQLVIISADWTSAGVQAG